MSVATQTLKPTARRGRAFPRGPLFGIFALVAFSFAAVVFGRTTEIGTLRNPSTAPLAIRDVRFLEQADDTIQVVDDHGGATLEVIQPNSDGFIRGALRGMGQQRQLRAIAADAPYRIILWDDRSLTMSDIATGQRIFLNAFGPTNAAAVARFIDKRSTTP